MAANVYTETARLLERTARNHREILVAYSGGKDSLAVLNLCAQAFERVVCFFMFLVPGLKVMEDLLQFARDRWKVEILQYPHWAGLREMRLGIYCNNYFREQHDWPEFNFQDVCELARQDTGIRLVAHGGKAKDSLWRKRYFHSGDHHDVLYPLKDWHKLHVLAYLKTVGIPIPNLDGTNKAASGMSLTTPTLLWLYDNHPDDFARVEEVFPYVRAVVARREFYGTGA